MKVLLLKDVYNLGRAGDVKKVADGYARNFLIPQKMAVLATAGALTHVERIQEAAAKQRQIMNEEMAELSSKIEGLELNFFAKVGESGKLFGSITQQMIAEAISEKIGAEVDRHRVESQPLREVGEHMVKIRLTFDLIPEVKVIVESEEAAASEADAKESRKRSKKSEESEPVMEEEIVEVEDETPSVDETEPADEA
ncbi:MAG: 50S ribosomal protein L9 [Chloroflexi bacterium]|nr:50S ribosomal protein L9 [Chloroflexota bacterium]